MTNGSARPLRFLTRALAAAAVFLFVLAARVVVASRGELAHADALAASGDVDGAIAHYRRAARWYAPLSPYPGRALDALARIADAAEAEGDYARALAAQRSIRAAILATRSTFVPHRARLEASGRRIAALMARGEPPPIDAERTPAERERAMLELLERPPGPSTFWSLVAVTGFFGWVGAAFVFSHRAIDADDRLVAPEARKWSALWALGFTLFCAGLALA